MDTPFVSNPAVLGGRPVVKETRISVEFLLRTVRIGCNGQGGGL